MPSERQERTAIDPSREPRSRLALEAVDRTAVELGLDADELSRALASGLLLEILLELKVACYLLPVDRDRLRSLIRRVERCRPDRGAETASPP